MWVSLYLQPRDWSLYFAGVWQGVTRWLPLTHCHFVSVSQSLHSCWLSPSVWRLDPRVAGSVLKNCISKKWMVFWGFGVFRLTSLASVKTYPLLIACGYNWLYILGTQGGIPIVFLITIIAVFIWESHGIAYSTTTRQPNQPTASPSVSLPGGTHHCGATGTAGRKAERSGGAKHWRCRSWLAGDNPQKSHW